MPPTPTIVCPLRFEHAHLRRVLPSSWEVCVGGRGAASIARWAERLPDPEGPVILAGLAGGLHDDAPGAGAAAVISEVRSRDGQRWTPPLRPDGPPRHRGCIATSVDRMLRTVQQKRGCREATGADIVDEESVAFARCADRCGWRWGIVRGVSDGPGADLPAGVDRWVGDDGATRVLRVTATLVRHPGAIAALRRLHASSRAALDAAGPLLIALTDDGPTRPAATLV